MQPLWVQLIDQTLRSMRGSDTEPLALQPFMPTALKVPEEAEAELSVTLPPAIAKRPAKSRRSAIAATFAAAGAMLIGRSEGDMATVM